jgi:hypothetical protein
LKEVLISEHGKDYEKATSLCGSILIVVEELSR